MRPRTLQEVKTDKRRNKKFNLPDGNVEWTYLQHDLMSFMFPAATWIHCFSNFNVYISTIQFKKNRNS